MLDCKQNIRNFMKLFKLNALSKWLPNNDIELTILRIYTVSIARVVPCVRCAHLHGEIMRKSIAITHRRAADADADTRTAFVQGIRR